MRILFTIPHYFQAVDDTAANRSSRPSRRTERVRGLARTVYAIHQLFGRKVFGLDHFSPAAWRCDTPHTHDLDIVICTTGSHHLLDDAPVLGTLTRHHPTEADPLHLGFVCHALMRDRLGHYDYYAYVEDDILLVDPLHFKKLALFNDRFGDDALLQPNRYETGFGVHAHKVYVDYHMRPGRTAPFQNVEDRPRLSLEFLGDTVDFERTSYPSAGCFFLNRRQMAHWAGHPCFLDGDVRYLSPLDSAATLGVMKTFRIYKPALSYAAFLEVVHASPRWFADVGTVVQPRELSERTDDPLG